MAEAELAVLRQAIDKPHAPDAKEAENFMLSCLKNALHNELPMSKTKKSMQSKCPGCDIAFAHHWDAGHRKLWSPAVEYRLKPMDALDKRKNNCTIWEVGAHEKADDSKALMKIYDQCRYHAFEPIPNFSTKLRQRWAGESRMTIHTYGIGKEDSSFSVSEEALKGQATYIADQSGGSIQAQIKSFDYALEDSEGIPTLLHMNCEGCEWQFLEDAKKHGFLNKVPVIQVGWHNYGDVGLGARVWQLCELREMLSETHVMSSGLAFGWDRWELKDKLQ
jgi:FkbM family methyltransferase